tara:strand:- start:2211 stop:3617 length:1407 start_codon:yes stop_codon:yes gene_type:complete
MPFSYTESVGDGTVTTFTAPPHLDSSHLTVSVDGAVKTITTDYVVSGTQVTFTVSHGAPANNAKVLIQRNSSRSTRLTDYSDSSVLTADALDKDANQIFYIAQESFDSSALDSAQIVLNTAAIATKANDNEVVKLTGDQTISGNKTFSSDSLLIPSSSVIQLGDNQTSQIGEFSTLGLNNNATTLTDSLKVGSDNIVLHSGKTYFTSGSNSDVNLEVDNTGIDVTGNITVSGTVDGVDIAALNTTVSGKANIASPTFTGTITADGLTLGDNESINLNTDLEIKSSGGVSEIIETGSGNLVVKAADLSLNDSNNFRRVYCTDGSSGSVKLYYGDTSNTGSKLNTTNTGVNITGTLNADAITSTPTTEVVSTNTVPTVAVNKKYINTYSSGVNAYTLPTGTAGQMITFVNASSQNITLARNTNSITLSKVIAGSDPANVTDDTITVGKSGTVEVVYTGTNTAVIFGSGLS